MRICFAFFLKKKQLFIKDDTAAAYFGLGALFLLLAWPSTSSTPTTSIVSSIIVVVVCVVVVALHVAMLFIAPPQRLPDLFTVLCVSICGACFGVTLVRIALDDDVVVEKKN